MEGEYLSLDTAKKLAKSKALLPEGVEAVVISKDDYDRLSGELTKENIELKLEIERLHSIIKEVREYITYWHYRNDFRINSFTIGVKEELLEILDKGSDKE